jgi:hypothetical protein
MSNSPAPLVVQYLYVHEREEGFYYPTIRADASAHGVAIRYLECALTQAASLRLQDAPCDLALATNIRDAGALGDTGAELIARLEALGVEMLPTDYVHRPTEGTRSYVASRYVLDAILSAAASQPAERILWLTDLDCVWPDPALVFAAAPSGCEIGCIYMGYQPEWDAVGHGEDGRTRVAIGKLAAGMGGSAEPPQWVGGELLCGTPSALRGLVNVCEELDKTLEQEGKSLPNEEQILTLAGASGRVAFRDLSSVARRMPTGPRSGAPRVADPQSIGLWHLPSEKGLSLRRTARELRQGRDAPLREDLSDPHRAARRFNVDGTGLRRRLLDDGWLALQRVRSAALTARARPSGRAPAS